MATIGFSKVFILDKYFTELQKFWETEKKLQGMQVQGNQSPFIFSQPFETKPFHKGATYTA